MKIVHFEDVAIAGVACAVPTCVVRTMESKDFSEHELKRFVKGTGVKERRKAVAGQTASDLCYAAARALMQKHNMDAASIDALIYVTQFADYFIPSTAYILAYRLGLPQECAAFDVNLGCSAFVYGVHIASSLIAGGGAGRVLVLIGDVFRWGYENPHDALLFGDCGSAVLVERARDKNVASMLYSDGMRHTAVISYDGSTFNMAGDDILKFSMIDVPNAINNFLSETGKEADDYDYVLLHQANIKIVEMIARKIGIKDGIGAEGHDMSRVPIVLDRFGNTNGSSIPLALADLKAQGKLPAVASILSCGFGVGLSWGVNSFEIDAESVLPLIETDKYFDRGEKWTQALRH